MLSTTSNNRSVRAEGYSQSVPYSPADPLIQSINMTLNNPVAKDITLPITLASPSMLTILTAQRPLTFRGLDLHANLSVFSAGATIGGTAVTTWSCSYLVVVFINRFDTGTPTIGFNSGLYPSASTAPAVLSGTTNDPNGVLCQFIISGSSQCSCPSKYNRQVTAVLNEKDAIQIAVQPLSLGYEAAFVAPTNPPRLAIINSFYITN